MKLTQKILVLILLCMISSTVFSDEMGIRKDIKQNVLSLYLNEKFEELDLLAEKYRDPSERTSSGLWKLTMFYSAFHRLTGSQRKDEKYWKGFKDDVDKWIISNPKSPTAYIVKGIVLEAYAWKFRGGAWADEVPNKAWKPFKDNLKIAEEYMLNNKEIAANDPHWYGITADIKKGLGEDIKTYKEFIDEGLDRFPNYYKLYFSAIDYLAPKWHGDKHHIEEFANQAVSRTNSNEGMGMYARIYWYASQTQYDKRLFLDSDVVWSKMREGIFDVIKKYPDSWNIQNFAFFSCLANDEETTRILLDKMSDPLIIQAWQTRLNYDYCRTFAYPVAPSNIEV